ncbi:MAG: roadblock/LC7 domain-containing protein [Candidatus Ranarchaeia archaeon]
MSSVPIFSEKLVLQLTNILERVAKDINLESLAVITQTGRKIAFYSKNQELDPDLLAALSAAMANMGNETVEKLNQGTLFEVIVRGSKGYAITTSAGPKLALIGASLKLEDLGMIVNIMRDAATKIGNAISP